MFLKAMSTVANVFSYHITSYHTVHFSGASSKTPPPQPFTKQVSFQQCCKCSWGQCRVMSAVLPFENYNRRMATISALYPPVFCRLCFAICYAQQEFTAVIFKYTVECS